MPSKSGVGLRRRSAPRWLPILLIVGVVCLAVMGGLEINKVPFWMHEVEAPASAPAAVVDRCQAEVTKNGSIDLEALRECTGRAQREPPNADTVKAGIDEVKFLLTLILSIAALFTVLQAAAAWFSATTYDKQAADKLRQIDEVQQGIRARYPLFEAVESARKKAHSDLAVALRAASASDDPSVSPLEAVFWLDNFYRNWDFTKRQRLLSVESFVSIDIDPGSSSDVPEDLKRFAAFYHAKYRYERTLHVASFGDLERAQHYLVLAAESAPHDFTIGNELGNLYLTVLDNVGKLPALYPDYLKLARAAFDSSLELEPKQQRAYYNLAFLANNHDHDYKAARDYLRTALSHTKWQQKPTPTLMKAYLHYNLGCNLARILAAENAVVTAAQAVECTGQLHEAAKSGDIGEKTVKADFEDPKTGDLYELYAKADAELKAQLTTLRKELLSGALPDLPEKIHPWRDVGVAVASACRLTWGTIRPKK